MGLTRQDRLAIRSSTTDQPLGTKQMNKWMTHAGVTYDSENKQYKFGEASYNSFDDAVSEIYKDNPAAAAYQQKVASGKDFQSVMDTASSMKLGSAVGNGLSNLGSLIGNKYGDDFSAEQKASQTAIRGALESIPVVGSIISAATGLIDGLGTVTGLNLSNVDSNAAERAGIKGAATASNILNSLPGVSMLAGIFADRTDSFAKSDSISNLGGAYSGTMGDLDAAASLSEKRMFGAKKANSFISEAKGNQRKMIDINNINSTRLKGVTSESMSDYNNYRNSKYQGSTQYAVGRRGLKLPSIEEINRILDSRKTSEIQEFKNGGVIGIDSSIIPEGKLHAHKHHLSEFNSELEDVTKKGIPVITIDADGELQQVAEIEKEEIIFRKEITSKLEELYKNGSDEDMIEAGKLIAEELMTNTDDKTEEFINE